MHRKVSYIYWAEHRDRTVRPSEQRRRGETQKKKRCSLVFLMLSCFRLRFFGVKMAERETPGCVKEFPFDVSADVTLNGVDGNPFPLNRQRDVTCLTFRNVSGFSCRRQPSPWNEKEGYGKRASEREASAGMFHKRSCRHLVSRRCRGRTTWHVTSRLNVRVALYRQTSEAFVGDGNARSEYLGRWRSDSMMHENFAVKTRSQNVVFMSNVVFCVSWLAKNIFINAVFFHCFFFAD